MRIRDDFTVFPREMASGKVIWYYQTYDEEGRRTVARSTGESTRTAAVKKCNSLMRERKLLPKARARLPTFAEYAEGWWEPETCKYLQKRLSRKALSARYTQKARYVTDVFLIPYFGKMRLDRITDEDIDTWLVNFGDRERRHFPGKKASRGGHESVVAPPKLSANYANQVFGTLRLMLKEAVKRHIIPFSPADNVDKLAVEPKQVEILTLEEFREMVNPKPKVLPALPLAAQAEFDVKGLSMELAKTANFLAACTGMRIGEVLGLRGECVFADFIRVQGQYGIDGYGPTKTRTCRNIPLTPVIMDGLRRLVEMNGNGFLFSTDGGAKPITRYWFNKFLEQALAEIGIDAEEKKRRNLSAHSWRYFLNTNLRAVGVADAKVQSITGHKTLEMTERYTQFYAKQFDEVRDAQETLLLPSERTDEERPARARRRSRASRTEAGGTRRKAALRRKRRSV